MPTHVAIQPGRLYPQPGFTLRIDKEGKWSATQVFICHRASVASLMPRPGTQHPEISFISVSQTTATITEGDLAEIVCEYAGAEAKEEDREKESAVYTMGLSLSEEPLLSHPRYASLSEDERTAIQQIASGKEKDDQGRALKDKVTSETGREALAKIGRGQTSYYSPRVTWRESWVRITERQTSSGSGGAVGEEGVRAGVEGSGGGGSTFGGCAVGVGCGRRGG
jgi:hypothetical protein